MAGLHSNYTTERDGFRRVEVISGVARRRHWPRSEKARIVAESYAPGASATAVAVRHGLHRNQIFAWRRQLRNRAALIDGIMPEFVPVRWRRQRSPVRQAPAGGGRIEVIAAGLTIRLGSGFDSSDLRRVLQIRARTGMIAVPAGVRILRCPQHEPYQDRAGRIRSPAARGTKPS
jgi:transposase